MGLHALVIMPYGRHQEIDFDAVYSDYLKPALEDAGLAVFRADDEQRAGDTDTALFKELLCADLVLVDQTLRTANAWYRLDLLRAFRARDVLCMRGLRSDQTPDSDSDRPERYQLRDGGPDPEHLDADRNALTAWARSAQESSEEPATESEAPEGQTPARRVFLFSGHMIDAADRPRKRFPAGNEGLAAEAIAARLDQLGMDGNDLAICGGACGGDLLFAEAALQRGCRLQLYLPYSEAQFLKASVAFAGQSWVDRYAAVKANALTRIYLQPDLLGPPAHDIDPYVRNNLWQLYTALAHGIDKLRFIALWNGEGGSAPGGTQNMVETVRRYAGQVIVLDTQLLFGRQTIKGGETT
jgi:hypothetical protein